MLSSLSYYKKFSPGSDLWCLFYEPDKALFKSINWRTHFMIHKIKESFKLTHPLLIESSAFFPNQYLLCLPKTHSIKEIEDLWVKLNKPSTRFFFSEESPKGLLDFWNSKASSYKLSYYTDKA